MASRGTDARQVVSDHGDEMFDPCQWARAYPTAFQGSGVLRARIDRTDEYTIIALDGEFDLAAVSSFDALISDLAETAPSAIVVDLSSLSYFDARGIRALVQAHDDVPDTCRFGVMSGAGPAHRVLSLAALEGALPMNLDESVPPT